MTASDRLAYDRASVRRIDHDGRLHVELTNISKANICPYYGREIPGAEALGLKPNTIYRLFRSPDELKKGADTSNNIQLMQVHDPVTPEAPKQMKVVGTTGTDAVFEAPYLKNSLAVWVQSAIDLIDSDEKKELSCAYHYVADMTSGTYEGEPYDGVMREIRFNHVALVEQGRAGPDVMVQDEMPIGLTLGDPSMTKPSNKALLLTGALTAYVRPKLAQDAKMPDLKAVLLGTTALNYVSAKPTIAARLKAAMTGKLAKDASLEDMHGLLDSLDREGEDEMDDDAMDEDMSEEEKAEEKKARAEDRKGGKDEAACSAARDARKGARDSKRAADKAAMDAEAETEEEKKERMEKRAKDKAAKDAKAKDESPEEKEKRERSEREAEDRRAKDNKKAMDSAIATAISTEQKRNADIREAENVVRPWIGNLVMAQDSAEDIYRLALDSLGVKNKGLHADALRPILEAQPKPGASRPRMAHDAAAAKTFAEANPNVARIRTL